MKTNNVEERYKRIEGYIDAVYDMAYGALDSVFIGVDYVYTQAKKRAEKRAQRVSTTLVGESEDDLTLADKVECLIKHADDHGHHKLAELMRKQLKAGIYDAMTVDKKFSGLPEEYKNRTRRYEGK